MEIEEAARIIDVRYVGISQISPQHFYQSVFAWHVECLGLGHFAAHEVFDLGDRIGSQRDFILFPVLTDNGPHGDEITVKIKG